MRAVVQRVARAEVSVEGVVAGAIGRGLLVYAGVEKDDTPADIEYIASKVAGLRVFEDTEGRMNLDVMETGGNVLVVSQFTLLGDLRKGRRPSFERAETPDKANALYGNFIKALTEKDLRVQEGKFQAHMQVDAVNDGPVTILLDSRKTF